MTKTTADIYEVLKEKALEECKKEMLRYYTENEEDFDRDIEELDCYNGYLQDDRYYNMYEFEELNQCRKLMDVINDIDFSNFNINDEYFQFTIYGIQSDNEKDYTDYLTMWNINDMIEERIENPRCIEYCEEIEEIIEKYENRVGWLKNRQ